MPEDFNSQSFDTTTNAASSAADTEPVAPAEDAPEIVTLDKGTDDANADTEAEKEQVPFHEHPRWQEVQRERQELKARLADLEPFAEIVAGFKEQGYTNAEAVRAAIDNQQQEAQAQEAQEADETWKAGIAETLLARVADPDDEMTRGEAEAVFRAAQLERDLTQRDQFGAADRTETAAKALTARYPQMDAETVRDLLDAGRPDRAEAAAQRTHTQATKAAERTIADYNAKRATAPRPVEGVGGGVGGTRSVADMGAAEFLEYDKQLVRAAERR